MAKQPSEEQGNSIQAEPAADIENVFAGVGSAFSQSGGASDTESVCASVVSAFSQSGGSSEILEKGVDAHYYRPLIQAAFRGDWKFAKRFFERDAASKTAKITSRSETVLHVAALSAQDHFFENLVELLSPYPEVLEMVDCDSRTALHNAVLCGRIRMIKALVRSDPKLTQFADKNGRVPLGIAALEASMHKDIAWFLAKNTTYDGPNHPFSSPDAIDIFLDLTYAGHHDIALYLVERCPRIMTRKSANHDGVSILRALAMMTSHFPRGARLSVMEALIYQCLPVDLNYKPTNKNSDPALQCLTRSLWNAAKIVVPTIKRVHEVKMKHMTTVELAKRVCMEISSMNTDEISDFFQDGELLFQAIAKGNSEIIKLCIQFFPELIRIRHGGDSLITLAVIERQERILGLFLKLSSTAELSLVRGPTWQDSLDMIDAAASYEPRLEAVANVVGAAFQLQREIQWYKAVESWVSHFVRTAYFLKDSDNKGITKWHAFVREHKLLLQKGEKWVKDMANSCMLVSTLIVTILFAAAFTVPGGNDNNTGVPLLLGQDSLLIFAISDALGLFSSVTAILLFLAILTSRCEVQDFLYSLPKKIIMGLCFLFLSLGFMLVAFAATLTIVLDKRVEWVLIPITLLAFVLLALFAVLQLPLLFQMIKSTYGPSIFYPESIWDGVKYIDKIRD
ncbi:hypothetical protein ACJRO7_015966 [Eucalyptus globulus]|uniref:PGG domain-containing protein n=1 Tax=Eucalyptus globulus TaxID=34317 RepID=A0ABD3L982_EUCGL